MLIPFAAPYDLRGTLCGGQAFRWREEGDGWFCGVIFGNVVRMRRAEDGIEFVSAPDDEASLVSLVRDYLRVDDDMDEVYGALSEDEHLADAVKQHQGTAGAASGTVGVSHRVHLLGEQQYPAHNGECGGHGYPLRQGAAAS